MPNIPFPSVPEYPGVPQLIRPAQAAIAQSPVLAVTLGTVSNLLAQALQQGIRWGIFDLDGNQLGIASSSASIVSALESQITGIVAASATTNRFDYLRESRVSDFAVEGGEFATYNKVLMSANPIVTLTMSGSESDRTYFLGELDLACQSVEQYNIVTPEIVYTNYTIERFTLQRTAQRGATLLTVEISLREVREVSAAYSQSTPIQSPQNAASTPQVDNGKVQAVPPDTSTAKSIANKFMGLSGGS